MFDISLIIRYFKTSSRVVSFTRSIKAKDLIHISGNVPDNSLAYTKLEKSTFINKVLYSSRGMLQTRVDYGQNRSSDHESPTMDTKFQFDKEFEANGSYVVIRKYCKQRGRRSFIFADVTSQDVQKGTLKAIMNVGECA